MVLINAAAALVVAGKTGQLSDGIQLAAQAIDSGAAAAKLDEPDPVHNSLKAGEVNP